jgi:hypothetical protein
MESNVIAPPCFFLITSWCVAFSFVVFAKNSVCLRMFIKIYVSTFFMANKSAFSHSHTFKSHFPYFTSFIFFRQMLKIQIGVTLILFWNWKMRKFSFLIKSHSLKTRLYKRKEIFRRRGVLLINLCSPGGNIL